MANQLETIMANFSDEREHLQRAIEEETDAINRIKDKLAKCDDVSGTDEDLVKRLQNTKVNKIIVYVSAIYSITFFFSLKMCNSVKFYIHFNLLFFQMSSSLKFYMLHYWWK